MQNLGKHLLIKKKISPLLEKDIFCDIVDLYEEVALRGVNLQETTGIGLTGYNEDFYVIIENLLFLKYGEWKTEIITWYVWERKDIITGDIGAMEYTNEVTDVTKEVIIKCAEDLWDVLKEIDNQNT